VAAVGAALLAPAVSAGAEPDAAEPAPTFVTTEWEETSYGADGSIVSARSGTGEPPGAAGVEPAGHVTGASQTGAGARAAALRRSAIEADESAGDGCRSIRAAEVSHTALDYLPWVTTVAYKWNHGVYFCWDYPHIVYYAAGEWLSDADENFRLADWWGHGHWYEWRGADRGGHYSFRQAMVQNCLLYLCHRTEYPYVQIWINGNGAWAANTSG